MTGEMDIFGLYVPELLVYAILALLVQVAQGRVLSRVDAHRLVWHPALVEISGYFIWLGGIVMAAHWVRA